MGRTRLLIVDDDADIVAVLAARYRAKKFEVLEAPDGPEALLTACRRRPDVVILDVHMPKLDGVAVFRELMELLPRVRVIVVSGEAGRTAADLLLEEGAADFIPKPIDLARLDTAVEAFA